MERIKKTIAAAVSALATLLAGGLFIEHSSAADGSLSAEILWRYNQAQSGCEIACFEPRHSHIYVTIADGVSILDARSGERLVTLPAPAGFHATSISLSRNLLAIAWAAQERTALGKLELYRVPKRLEDQPCPIVSYPAGFLPDMVTFSPDGRWLLSANEGEPSDNYAIDPEGSITAIDLAPGIDAGQVHQLSFQRFNSQRESLRAVGVRIFGPSQKHSDKQATVAEDLEPEYIAVSADSNRAWVSLQENNAIAEIELLQPRITTLHPLGEKSYQAGSPAIVNGMAGFDASDSDGGTHIQQWPVSGMPQPDSIAALHADGVDYLLSVNEGDPRKYTGFEECCAVGKLSSNGLPLDEQLRDNFPLKDSQLGRLQVSTAIGDQDGDGDLDRLYCFGSRSFSVFHSPAQGPIELVFDSGHDFERITAQSDPERYNADSVPDSRPDVRSPKRGPEPEGLAIGNVGARQIAAIGLERAGGVMLYDISSPATPVFLKYLPPYRDEGTMDCAPEGLLLIPEDDSPVGKALLVVCYEKSHTVTAYSLAWNDE